MRLPWLSVALLFSAGTLCAQQDLAGGDPPSRVARLNYIDGNVSFQPASLDSWTGASLNYPLTTGDHIYSDVGSHAEMHIGPNALRLGSQSNFGFLNLDDHTVQVRFTEGALEIRLRLLEEDDVYEVDTPQGAISLLRTGDYRIETDPNRNATMVTVRAGEVEVTANGGSFTVRRGQTSYFADGGQPDTRDANPLDAFDDFTNDRNTSEDRIPPPVHVPSTMEGYQDLDRAGTWQETPDDGWVWAPRVQAGWAPYQEGHWAWVEPWGWTWVDDAPWGFAPFHYGRWANRGGVWVWVPGPIGPRPVYAPALVVFVGGGSFGVGWFPLAPREPFYPSYHVSNTYVQRVNVTRITNVNITNVTYVNQRVPGAVISVPQGTFAGAQPIRGAARPLNAQEAARAQVMTSAQVAPQRESVLGNARMNAAVAHPSQQAMTRAVVAKSAPPPAAVSFQAKQQMLQANQGRPLAPEQVQQIRSQQPAALINRTPIRMNSAPQPAPVNRMDSRPPTARPAVAPQTPSAPVQPQFARPAPEARPAPAQTESRPQPVARPAAVSDQKATEKGNGKVKEKEKDVKKEEKKP